MFDGPLPTPGSHPVGYTKHNSARLSKSVVSVSMTLTAEEMTFGSGRLPPGHYACRWLVDGAEVGRRPFTVAA